MRWFAATIIGLSIPAAGQWLKYKTPGIPRMADGKPAELKPAEIQPWAETLRLEDLGKDHPNYRCLPGIGPYVNFGMYKILQTPGAIAFLSEAGGYRQVLTDGRPLPADPNPTWQGYSVGHWDGDTLVVESAGFNDLSWLDAGHPHTEEDRKRSRINVKLASEILSKYAGVYEM